MLLIHEVGECGVYVGVWCVVSAAGIVWSIIFSDCTNSSRYVTRQTPTPFFIHQIEFPVILSLFKIEVDLGETQMLGHRRILKQGDGNTGIYHHERGVPEISQTVTASLGCINVWLLMWSNFDGDSLIKLQIYGNNCNKIIS